MQYGLKAVSVLAVAGLALLFSTAVVADPLTVKTEQGKLHGTTINEGKVNAFLGLPYAAPPVGELRFKAPEPAAKIPYRRTPKLPLSLWSRAEPSARPWGLP